MEVKAKAKFIKTSPKKVRLVANLIRGLDVDKAGIQLQFSNKNAATPLSKLLKSAIVNAEENDNLKRDNLFIKEIRVDEGPALKRWMPRAMGRATPIIKKTSHIHITLAEKVPTIRKEKVKKEDNKDDVIKLEDLGKVSGEDKRETKRVEKAKIKSAEKKGANKLFNRKTGS